jgi:hypothetical protein
MKKRSGLPCRHSATRAAVRSREIQLYPKPHPCSARVADLKRSAKMSTPTVRAGIASAVVGTVVIPGGCILAYECFKIVFGTWTICIWPSSIFLLATAGRENGWFAWSVVLVAVVTNGILYGAVGAAAYATARCWCQRGNKRLPNKSPQRNAGSHPSSDDSPASETPSSLGPRG